MELCHYTGKIRGLSRSWVALSTCYDVLSGVIYDGEELHYVENNEDSKRHFLYKHSDLIPDHNKTCGFDDPILDLSHHQQKTDNNNRMLRVGVFYLFICFYDC